MTEQESFGWALALKPFFLLFFFFGVFVIAKMLYPLIPSGRWKTVLFDKNLRHRHPWKFGLGLLLGGYLAMFSVAWWIGALPF